jgi:hypothetical protein
MMKLATKSDLNPFKLHNSNTIRNHQECIRASTGWDLHLHYIMDVEQTLQIPSFTLYPVTTQDLKTCYESQNCKVLCSLSGPYY